MDKEAVKAAISSLEVWGRNLDHWILICAAVVAIFLAAEVALSVSHWLNEKRLGPLRAQQTAFHTEELVKLHKSADEEKRRAENAEQRAGKAELALGARTLTTAQQLRIANRVRQFSGTPFDCAANPNPEPGGFLEQISSALEAAGWIRKAHDAGSGAALALHGKPEIGMINTGFAGLAIEISNEKIAEWGAAGTMLGAALEAEGITAIGMNRINDRRASSNAVHIVVGVKP